MVGLVIFTSYLQKQTQMQNIEESVPLSLKKEQKDTDLVRRRKNYAFVHHQQLNLFLKIAESLKKICLVTRVTDLKLLCRLLMVGVMVSLLKHLVLHKEHLMLLLSMQKSVSNLANRLLIIKGFLSN